MRFDRGKPIIEKSRFVQIQTDSEAFLMLTSIRQKPSTRTLPRAGPDFDWEPVLSRGTNCSSCSSPPAADGENMQGSQEVQEDRICGASVSCSG